MFEAQTWEHKYGNISHQHAGGNLPFYQRVSGVITLPVDILLHDAKGKTTQAMGSFGDDRFERVPGPPSKPRVGPQDF